MVLILFKWGQRVLIVTIINNSCEIADQLKKTESKIACFGAKIHVFLINVTFFFPIIETPLFYFSDIFITTLLTIFVPNIKTKSASSKERHTHMFKTVHLKVI